MRDDEGEDEDGEEGEREDEHVEEAVVPPPHAVPHPGTVVVEALCVERERRTSLFRFQGQAHLTWRSSNASVKLAETSRFP